MPYRPRFDSLEDMIAQAADSVRPPDRLSVPEAAEKYRWIENPGNYTGPYLRELVPYMDEPGEVLTSHDFTGEVFVGPAQCAKTEGVMNWVTHGAIHDPADMMIVTPTMASSRDFSKRRLARLFRHTEELRKRLVPGRNNQNVLDVTFRSGMFLTLAHPAVSELSGKPIPRLWLTDYDRMPEDVDGEGNAFDLARKRATTFRRFGMTVAESSPGHEVENPRWISSTRHEAPPTKGVLALYNRGDRRRWYWKCPHCNEPFEGEFKHLVWPEDEGDDLFKAENAKMECPHCHELIEHSQKHAMNMAGRWVRDGQRIDRDGNITGQPFRSDIASFWLKGVAAAFADWKTLVLRHLKATEEYEKTGDEAALKATVNTDQGEPYTPKSAMAERLPEELKARAEDWGGTAKAPVVPAGVRFLTAAIDVQKSAFVVHVFGHGSGGDIWHIDMFKVRFSKRQDERERFEIIDPAGYGEDWHVLVEEVIEKRYPLAGFTGRVMQIKMACCDSGGKEGVTTNAYNFWRWLRDQPEGYHRRFQLVKGEPSKMAGRYKITYPDSQRKDRKAGARGDIPVAFINSNLMKDQVSAMLGRTDPFGGAVHFPKWAEDWLYTQLTAEVRTPKGWVATGSRRNEALDLLYYALALNIDKRINAEVLDWENPPGWAADWADGGANDLVSEDEAYVRFDSGGVRKKRSLSDLGKELA